MQCPLCGGPVHEEEPGEFACEVGHEVSGLDLERHADHRLAEALWMAIQALDNEAEVLRVTDGGEARVAFADEAEAQAQLLRSFARRHNEHLDA